MYFDRMLELTCAQWGTDAYSAVQALVERACIEPDVLNCIHPEVRAHVLEKYGIVLGDN